MGRLHTSIGERGFVKSVRGVHTREYRAYRDMLNRCYRPTHNRYHRYGGRGLSVCSRWLGEGGFDRFVEDMGLCPDGYSLDRDDNNLGYSPANCKWATAGEQSMNRSTTRTLEYCGEFFSIKELSDISNIPYSTLERRINKLGWSVETAVTKPVRKMRK